jgi:acyl homoserine lactone synthase
MIRVISLENAHKFGQVLPSLFRLRQRMFIDLQGWEIPSYNGMEYDTYDNPATIYLVHQEEDGEVTGMVRTYPTDRPYMLEEHWPHIVQRCALPKSPNVREGSRFVIDNRISLEKKKRIKSELVLAFLELGLATNVEKYIGVMPPKIWDSVFTKSGWPVRAVGDVYTLPDGSEIYAAEYDVTPAHLKNVRQATGINYSVLEGYEYEYDRSEVA